MIPPPLPPLIPGQSVRVVDAKSRTTLDLLDGQAGKVHRRSADGRLCLWAFERPGTRLYPLDVEGVPAGPSTVIVEPMT